MNPQRPPIRSLRGAPVRVAVIHWGKLGAGPLITSRLAEGFSMLDGVDVVASVADEADAKPRLAGDNLQRVTTYQGRVQMLIRLPLLPVRLLQARAFLRRHRVELAITTMVSLWQSIGIYLLLPRKTQLYSTIHDPVEHVGEQSRLATLLRSLEQRRASTIIAYSESSRQLLMQMLPFQRDVIAVPHGVSLDEAVTARTTLPDVPVIAFFGRLGAYKGLDIFVAGLRELRNRGVQFRAVARGAGTYDSAFLDESSDIVEWQVSWTPADQLVQTVDSFDIIVLPYTEATQSGVLPLAASRGVPTVVTPIPGLQEQVEFFRNAVVMKTMEAAALADALELLVRDSRLYETLSENGLSRSKGASWSEVAATILRNYKQSRA